MTWIVPNDIPLPLPAPYGILVTALLVSFALHILFVTLMLGGAILVVAAELAGLRHREWDRISYAIAATVTVNKSIAVVLGVAPLLSVSVLYTMYLYTANALTGQIWLMIVPLVIAAFLLSYLHKYSWHALDRNKPLHVSLAALAALLYLTIPLIFLSTINLMLYPERWREVSTFWGALLLPNVLPRYLHFLAATLSAAGLFFSWHLGRQQVVRTLDLETLTVADLRRTFLGLAFAATLAQLFLGPLVFMTLPARAVSALLIALLVCVLLLAATALWWMWHEARALQPGARFGRIVAVLSLLVCVMVFARHEVRETAVTPHRAQMTAKTAAYLAQVKAAQAFLVVPGGLGGRAETVGAALFRQTCGSCHAAERRLVGPALTEVARIYAGNADGIVAWALNPGKKRPDYPQMPAQTLPRADLSQIAAFILETGGK